MPTPWLFPGPPGWLDGIFLMVWLGGMGPCCIDWLYGTFPEPIGPGERMFPGLIDICGGTFPGSMVLAGDIFSDGWLAG